MADVMTAEQRSRCMARIRSKDTKPELRVRQLAHALGYRFRLHRRDLPGRPDLTFPSRRKIVLVHGCFWHQHHGCKDASKPKSRTDYWEAKFQRNLSRDAQNVLDLNKLGWSVLVIWECETSDLVNVADRLAEFLGPSGKLPT